MGLNMLMAHVPKERRIAFEATPNKEFPPIFPSEHKTKPDLSGTYPGKAAPPHSSWSWDLCPIDIEIKSGPNKDPIDLHAFKPFDVHDGPLAQIAKNGRNILAASGACFCFVIAVYGDMARIYRFDRARAVISPSFNLGSTNVLFRFLWRIVHPKITPLPDGSIPHTPKLLGLDTTVTTLTKEEKTWLRETLINIHKYDNKVAKTRAAQSKKMLAMYTPLAALSGDTNPTPSLKWCYTIGAPLSHSSGLFSRATKVLKVLFREDPNHFFAVKDSWRHVYRKNEIEFYNHIRKRYKSNYPPGVARALGVIDFGVCSDFSGHKTYSFEPYTVKDTSIDEKYGTQEDTAHSKGGEPASTGEKYGTQEDTARGKEGEPADGDNRSDEDQNQYDAGQEPDEESSEDGEIEGDATVEEDTEILSTPDEGYTSSRPETPPTSEPYTGPSSPAISEVASLPEYGVTNSSMGDAGSPPSLPQPDIPEPAIIDFNRSHTRMTMYPVGEEIASFNCTRDLVEAIRDAIKGTLLQYCRSFFSLLINE
jgi:hypothetical protein